jgi:L-rhamnose mutarotase
LEAQFERLSDISGGAITYYSVFLEDEETTEFDYFLDKEFPDHKNEIDIVYSVLELMKKNGAKQYYFKPENSANALPKVPQEIQDANTQDYGIRLYCIRLHDNLVVLLNGDIKTHIDPEQCKNVKLHFRRAKKIANCIDKMLIERELELLGKNPLDGLIITI